MLIGLEGSHRLAAAAELDLAVDIQRMRLQDPFAHDYQDLPENPCSVARLLAYLAEHPGPEYSVRVATRRRRT